MQYKDMEDGFFSKGIKENESQLTDKQNPRNLGQHQLAGVMLMGLAYIILEGTLTYLGILIQNTGAYFVGIGTYWYKTKTYYAYNHLYYTLGLVFFIGFSLIIYYVIFDKKIKKILRINILFVIPIIVTGVIATVTVWIVDAIQFYTPNELIGGYASGFTFGPDAMHYLTAIGWPIFIGIFAAVQIIKNIVILKVKNKATDK